MNGKRYISRTKYCEKLKIFLIWAWQSPSSEHTLESTVYSQFLNTLPNGWTHYSRHGCSESRRIEWTPRKSFQKFKNILLLTKHHVGKKNKQVMSPRSQDPDSLQGPVFGPIFTVPIPLNVEHLKIFTVPIPTNIEHMSN